MKQRKKFFMLLMAIFPVFDLKAMLVEKGLHIGKNEIFIQCASADVYK